MSSWQGCQASEPTYAGDGADDGAGAGAGAAGAGVCAPAGQQRRISAAKRLLSMHGVNRKLRARGMAYVTALSQRIGISQEVGRLALRTVTPAASHRSGLHRVSDRSLNPALGILNRIQTDRQDLLSVRTIDLGVADLAVLHIGGVSRRAHDREEHAGEVVNASAVAYDDVGVLGRPAWVGRGIHAIVKAVNQQTEVDALRRLGLVRLDRSGGARAGIGVRRIVAEHAVFGLIPPVSVQNEMHVALIAVGFGHHGAAGRYR